MPSRDTYTSGEIARVLEISDRTVRAYLRDGKISATQNPITGRWRVERKDLLAFMKQYNLEPKEIAFQPRILVVDYEPGIISLIRDILVKAHPDWVVDTTTSGYAALIRLGAEAPDLLILDISIPGTGGTKVLEAVRSNAKTASIKVVIVSGYKDRLEEMIEKGADAALEKPFMPQDLITATEKLLSHRFGAAAFTHAVPSG